MKKYRNYEEQVCDNVKNLQVVDTDSLPYEWDLPLRDLLMEIIDTADCKRLFEADPRLIEYEEFEYEYVDNILDSMYVLYAVELDGKYTDEHKRLEIFWNDELDTYLMPVYAFGMPWNMLSVRNSHYKGGF